MFFASLRKMFSMCPEERLMKLFPKQWVFPFLNTEKKKFRIFGGCFPQVSQNCSFRVQRNILWKAFSTRSLFSTFFLIEWSKFGFSWVFFRRLFKSFSLRQKWSFGEKFVLSKLPGKNFRKLSQNKFGFPTNVFFRNVKSVFHMSRGIVRSFFGERVLLQRLWTLSKKDEAVGQKWYRQGCEVEFDVSKAQFIRICRWKKNKVSLILRQGAIKISDGSTEISNRIVKLALWVTVVIFYGKKSKLLSAMTLRHSADNSKPFSGMSQAKLSKQYSFCQEKNFKENRVS